MGKTLITWNIVLFVFLFPSAVSAKEPAAAEIGRLIFSDTSLSNPAGQGCISCHNPQTAFADSRPVSPGAVAGRGGIRNAPSLLYAALIPPFAYEDFLDDEGREIYAWEGGMFHDGRAGDLFEQVQSPFFDPNEMNLESPAALAAKLRETGFAETFRQWTGDAVWKDDDKLNYHAFRALVEFLKEPLFRPFNAPIDDFLAGDESALTDKQKRGLAVYKEAGLCADCHFLEPANWEQPLLSDFGYDNLGVPSRGKKDPGLGGRTGEVEALGQFRAPGLRNIALTAPYMHNGSIPTLRDVLDFYNKRDVEPGRWGPTDYPETVNHDDMGDLGLTDAQIDDLLAFLDAFTDRHLLEKDRDPFSPPPGKVKSTEELKLHFPDYTHRRHPAYPGKPD